MRAVKVVVVHEPVEIVLKLLQGIVSGLSQGDLQELFENRPVESFSEAVCPGMPDLGVMMTDPCHLQEELEVVAACFPVGGELFTVVSHDVLEWHTVAFSTDIFDEINGTEDGLVGVEFSPSEGSRGVASGHLVDSSDALKTSDVEGIDTDQIAGVISVNMPGFSPFPGGFEFGAGDDFAGVDSNPFETVFAPVEAVALHNAVDGGSTDGYSLALQEVCYPLGAISWELIHH